MNLFAPNRKNKNNDDSLSIYNSELSEVKVVTSEMTIEEVSEVVTNNLIAVIRDQFDISSKKVVEPTTK